MNRRRLLLSAAGAGLAVSGLAGPSGLVALAATDDELAYASFGQAAEFLLKDFYAKTAAAKLVGGAAAHEVARGGLNASEHATALGKLLDGCRPDRRGRGGFRVFLAGRHVREWEVGIRDRPEGRGAAVGRLRGCCERDLDRLVPDAVASMAANVGQQVGFLRQQSGGRVIGVSFPPAVDVETASSAIETYLG